MIPGYCPKCGESVYLCASPLPCPYCTRPLPTTRDGRPVEYVAPEPGQAVVVRLGHREWLAYSPEQFRMVGDQLKRTFPHNRCVVMEEGMSFSVEDDQLRDLLSAAKQWRQATESRLRLTGPRGEAIPLAPDQALFDAIDKAEGKT